MSMALHPFIDVFKEVEYTPNLNLDHFLKLQLL